MVVVALNVLHVQLLLLPLLRGALLRKLLQLRRPLPLLVQLRTARRALDATRASGAVLSAPLGTTSSWPKRRVMALGRSGRWPT